MIITNCLLSLQDTHSLVDIRGSVTYIFRAWGNTNHFQNGQKETLTVRRSGVALAMRHKHLILSTYELSGLRQGQQHPVDAPIVVWHNNYARPRAEGRI